MASQGGDPINTVTGAGVTELPAKGGVDLGLAVGIPVAIVLFLLLVGLAVFLVWRWKYRRKYNMNETFTPQKKLTLNMQTDAVASPAGKKSNRNGSAVYRPEILIRTPSRQAELCVVRHFFEAKEPEHLTIETGRIVEVVQKNDNGWWRGAIDDKTGWFPASYVTKMEASEKIKYEEQQNSLEKKQQPSTASPGRILNSKKSSSQPITSPSKKKAPAIPTTPTATTTVETTENGPHTVPIPMASLDDSDMGGPRVADDDNLVKNGVIGNGYLESRVVKDIEQVQSKEQLEGFINEIFTVEDELTPRKEPRAHNEKYTTELPQVHTQLNRNNTNNNYTGNESAFSTDESIELRQSFGPESTFEILDDSVDANAKIDDDESRLGAYSTSPASQGGVVGVTSAGIWKVTQSPPSLGKSTRSSGQTYSIHSDSQKQQQPINQSLHPNPKPRKSIMKQPSQEKQDQVGDVGEVFQLASDGEEELNQVIPSPGTSPILAGPWDKRHSTPKRKAETRVHTYIAMFPFKAVHREQLSLTPNDVVVSKGEVVNGWLKGSIKDKKQEGWFPYSYVRTQEPKDIKQPAQAILEALNRSANRMSSPSEKSTTSLSTRLSPGLEKSSVDSEPSDLDFSNNSFDEDITGMAYQVVHPYTATQDGDLPLIEGEVVVVFEMLDNGWWRGVHDDKEGWFPGAYVEAIPQTPMTPKFSGNPFNTLPRNFKQGDDYEDQFLTSSLTMLDESKTKRQTLPPNVSGSDPSLVEAPRETDSPKTPKPDLPKRFIIPKLIKMTMNSKNKKSSKEKPARPVPPAPISKSSISHPIPPPRRGSEQKGKRGSVSRPSDPPPRPPSASDESGGSRSPGNGSNNSPVSDRNGQEMVGIGSDLSSSLPEVTATDIENSSHEIENNSHDIENSSHHIENSTHDIENSLETLDKNTELSSMEQITMDIDSCSQSEIKNDAVVEISTELSPSLQSELVDENAHSRSSFIEIEEKNSKSPKLESVIESQAPVKSLREMYSSSSSSTTTSPVKNEFGNIDFDLSADLSVDIYTNSTESLTVEKNLDEKDVHEDISGNLAQVEDVHSGNIQVQDSKENARLSDLNSNIDKKLPPAVIPKSESTAPKKHVMSPAQKLIMHTREKKHNSKSPPGSSAGKVVPEKLLKDEISDSLSNVKVSPPKSSASKPHIQPKPNISVARKLEFKPLSNENGVSVIATNTAIEMDHVNKESHEGKYDGSESKGQQTAEVTPQMRVKSPNQSSKYTVVKRNSDDFDLKLSDDSLLSEIMTSFEDLRTVLDGSQSNEEDGATSNTIETIDSPVKVSNEPTNYDDITDRHVHKMSSSPKNMNKGDILPPINITDAEDTFNNENTSFRQGLSSRIDNISELEGSGSYNNYGSVGDQISISELPDHRTTTRAYSPFSTDGEIPPLPSIPPPDSPTNADGFKSVDSSEQDISISSTEVTLNDDNDQSKSAFIDPISGMESSESSRKITPEPVINLRKYNEELLMTSPYIVIQTPHSKRDINMSTKEYSMNITRSSDLAIDDDNVMEKANDPVDINTGGGFRNQLSNLFDKLMPDVFRNENISEGSDAENDNATVLKSSDSHPVGKIAFVTSPEMAQIQSSIYPSSSNRGIVSASESELSVDSAKDAITLETSNNDIGNNREESNNYYQYQQPAKPPRRSKSINYNDAEERSNRSVIHKLTASDTDLNTGNSDSGGNITDMYKLPALRPAPHSSYNMHKEIQSRSPPISTTDIYSSSSPPLAGLLQQEDSSIVSVPVSSSRLRYSAGSSKLLERNMIVNNNDDGSHNNAAGNVSSIDADRNVNLKQQPQTSFNVEEQQQALNNGNNYEEPRNNSSNHNGVTGEQQQQKVVPVPAKRLSSSPVSLKFFTPISFVSKHKNYASTPSPQVISRDYEPNSSTNTGLLSTSSSSYIGGGGGDNEVHFEVQQNNQTYDVQLVNAINNNNEKQIPSKSEKEFYNKLNNIGGGGGNMDSRSGLSPDARIIGFDTPKPFHKPGQLRKVLAPKTSPKKNHSVQ